VSEEAPKYLYKYYHADRIDVLENSRVCFSHKWQLNDPGEGISSYERFLGARFSEQLNDAILSDYADKLIFESILQELKESGLDEVQSYLFAKTLSENNILRGRLLADAQPLIPELTANLDSLLPAAMEANLKQIGIFSMSEEENSSPMWAHYAANGNGFVLELNTNSSFFKNSNGTSNLFKIIYEDRELLSFFDGNESDILGRKSADWSYEREWRSRKMIVESDTLGGEYALFKYPRDLVHRVIIGERVREDAKTRILTASASSDWEVSMACIPPFAKKRQYLSIDSA